jgi:small subunit ribosomal protein S2
MSTPAVSMRDLLEAGVHFGHQTRRWHPSMKPFIYGERNGVHIINLQLTLPRFREALDFVRETTASGGSVLFVATKRQAQDIIAEQARACGQPFVHRRWLGGMLTNFRTIRRGIERYKELNELLGNEESSSQLSKKEKSRLVREQLKLHKAFEGLIDMERPPDALFVIDVRREEIAIDEAHRLGIPVIAVVDSNCDPHGIELSIPGNDDALRAIRLYCERVAEACREGKELFNSRIVDAGQAETSDGEEAAPKHGKRVVEITQPARRPARMERMAEERRREELEEAADFALGLTDSPAVKEEPAKDAETPASEAPPASEAAPAGEASPK